MSSRAQLINDVFALSTATLIEASLPLEMAQFLVDETEYPPLNLFLARVRFYSDYLEASSFSGDLSSYFAKLIEPTYKRLTWFEQETDTWLEK